MDNQDLENLELYQLMAEIEPVTQPDAISMWPQGPGWTVVLCLIVVLGLSVFAFKRYKRYQRRHRFYAIAAINALPNDCSALAISSILKRCALHDFERTRIAALTGSQWSKFLNQCCKKSIEFTDFYSLPADFDRKKLKQSAVLWLNHYEVAP